ncbi:hypothetical protein Agub_g8753, partial [Astrephomene gubernaculifera]
LCLAAEGLPEADVSSLVARLLQQAQSGRSSGISRSSLLGAALGATRLHPTDWGTRQQVLSELRAQLLTGSTAVVRSAAATAIAVLAGSLAADPAVYIRTSSSSSTMEGSGGEHSRELVAVSEALSYLMTNLGALCPLLAPAVSELASSGLPADWPRPAEPTAAAATSAGSKAVPYGRGTAIVAPKPLADEADEQEVLPGTAVALVSMLCDINRAHGLPAGALSGLLAALVQVAAAASPAATAAGTASDGGNAGTAAAAAAAALEAAAALAPEVLRYQQLPANGLSDLLTTLRRLYGSVGDAGDGSAAAAADGRVRGAAAYCLGCVAAAAMRQGLLTSELLTAPPLSGVVPPPGSDATATTAAAALSQLVVELSGVATGGSGGGDGGAASKGPHVAAARAGAVAGLVALLLPPPASLAEALAPIPPGAVNAGLLAQPENLAPAKAAVRALESLATEDTD